MLKSRPLSYIKGISSVGITLHAKRLNPAAELPSKPQKELFYMPKCYPHKYYIHDDHPTLWSSTKESINRKILTKSNNKAI